MSGILFFIFASCHPLKADMSRDNGVGRGRPVTAWTDDIKKWVGESLAVASNKAKDREEWRALVKTTAVPVSTLCL